METTGGAVVSNENGYTVEKALFTYSEEEMQENKINKAQAELVLNPKFIPVYPFMLRAGFSPVETILFGFIDFFLDNNDRFYCTNEQMAKMLDTSEKTVSLAVNKLCERGLLKVNYKMKSGGGKIRFISIPTYADKICEPCCTHDITKSNVATLQNVKSDITKSNDIYNKIIENKKIKNNKKEKRKFLDYVYLTDTEYNKLINSYGVRVVEGKIDDLNNYIGQKGKDKYSSHYHTILAWFKREGIKPQNKKQENESGIYDLPF